MDMIDAKLKALRFRAGTLSVSEFFEYIWHSRGKRIYFYIRKMFPGVQYDADDLFQDVMLKIFRNLERYNPAHSLDTWIFTIARNHCIDQMKRKDSSVELRVPEEWGTEQGNPEASFLRDERMRAIDSCMGGLAPEDRELAFLRFYGNMGFRNISVIMDININTLKARMRRIKRIFQQTLREYHEE